MKKQQTATDYQIDLGDMVVHVTRKRVRNVNFRLGADGVARMSVPWSVSRERAEELAREYAPWFYQRRRAFEERKARDLGFGVEGREVMVWGEALTLVIERGGDRPACERRGDALVVVLAEGQDDDRCAEVVEDWYAEQLRQRVAEIRDECERLVGRHASSITLRRMTTRWGSCSVRSGRIRLNVALAECPVACTRMVLIHEFCHLREANHGPRFKALMDLCCPDWRACERWLDAHPPRRRYP